jgi:hypothetical protein
MSGLAQRPEVDLSEAEGRMTSVGTGYGAGFRLLFNGSAAAGRVLVAKEVGSRGNMRPVDAGAWLVTCESPSYMSARS